MGNIFQLSVFLAMTMWSKYQSGHLLCTHYLQINIDVHQTIAYMYIISIEKTVFLMWISAGVIWLLGSASIPSVWTTPRSSFQASLSPEIHFWFSYISIGFIFCPTPQYLESSMSCRPGLIETGSGENKLHARGSKDTFDLVLRYISSEGAITKVLTYRSG